MIYVDTESYMYIKILEGFNDEKICKIKLDRKFIIDWTLSY